MSQALRRNGSKTYLSKGPIEVTGKIRLWTHLNLPTLLATRDSPESSAPDQWSDKQKDDGHEGKGKGESSCEEAGCKGCAREEGSCEEEEVIWYAFNARSYGASLDAYDSLGVERSGPVWCGNGRGCVTDEPR